MGGRYAIGTQARLGTNCTRARPSLERMHCPCTMLCVEHTANSLLCRKNITTRVSRSHRACIPWHAPGATVHRQSHLCTGRSAKRRGVCSSHPGVPSLVCLGSTCRLAKPSLPRKIGLYCLPLYFPALHCTVLPGSVLYCPALSCTTLYCTLLYCTALNCSVLPSTTLYCPALYSCALYCTALHCTGLPCTVL